MAWEVNPAIDWHKGSAVQAMVEAIGHDAMIFYAGDSANDIEAFEAVGAVGGITVGVGTIAPPAQHRVDSPDEILEFLIALIAALQVQTAVTTGRSNATSSHVRGG
jgi:trehalose-6-phosphatase